MFSSINSFGVSGIGGYGVEVEVYISNGLPDLTSSVFRMPPSGGARACARCDKE